MKNIDYKNRFTFSIKLCSLGIMTGLIGGLVSAVFVHMLSFVTELREWAGWIIFLLPIGGITIVFLYRAFGIKDGYGTNTVIHNLINNSEIKPVLAPLIFISTVITHLFGGSAGKEGAAIQLGGATAYGLSKPLRLTDDERTVFIICGMGAVFAGMFGTPVTAAVFVMEFRTNRSLISLAALPCIISTFIAKFVAQILGVKESVYKLESVIPFSFITLGKVLVLSVGICFLAFVMCFVFSKTKAWVKKTLSDPYIRVLIGSAVLIVLTVCVGDMRYNGSGLDMAFKAVNGESDWYDFVLKLIFTVVTMSVGFKGGEIVPTFCIGATFGCVSGVVLGLDVGFAAMLGLVGLFCCATNSFLSGIVLSLELFGVCALPYSIIVCVIVWLIPTKYSLFQNRIFTSPFLRDNIKSR